MALRIGRRKLHEGTEQKRAHTNNCHRQVKGMKEERKQIFGEGQQFHLQSLLGCCTEGQLITNLVQRVRINISQVPHFTWCSCLTCSAVVAVLQRLRDSGTQFLCPKGDGKAQGPARKLAVLLQSSIPLGMLL